MESWTIVKKVPVDEGTSVTIALRERQLDFFVPPEESLEQAAERYGKLLESIVEDEEKKKQSPVKEIPEAPKHRKGCCGGKKSMGAAEFLKVKLSGKVSGQQAYERFMACIGCAELGADGERLFREIDGVFYCGTPRLEHIYRDPVSEGCGCNLKDKVRYKAAACPRGLWGPV